MNIQNIKIFKRPKILPQNLIRKPKRKFLSKCDFLK